MAYYPKAVPAHLCRPVPCRGSTACPRVLGCRHSRAGTWIRPPGLRRYQAVRPQRERVRRIELGGRPTETALMERTRGRALFRGRENEGGCAEGDLLIGCSPCVHLAVDHIGASRTPPPSRRIHTARCGLAAACEHCGAPREYPVELPPQGDVALGNAQDVVGEAMMHACHVRWREVVYHGDDDLVGYMVRPCCSHLY